MKRLICLLACLLALAASAAAPDKALAQRAREAVTAGLKDPYSAVVENLRVLKHKNGDIYVCGTVNAKNSYGAFIGRKAFLYEDNPPDRFVKIEGDPVFDVVISSACGR